MRLSDLKKGDIKEVSQPQDSSPLKLSDIHPDDIAHVADVQPEETPGYGESLGRGLANGATLGFEPQIVGALEAAKDSITGNNKDKSALDLYRQYRDSQYKANDAAKAANPKTYFAGNLAGGAATSFVPGLNIGASLEGAAGLGALAGLGNSRADLTKGEIAPAIRDAAVGAGVGMALKPVGDYLTNKFAGTATPALENISEDAQRKAGDHALKALGVTRSQMQEELDQAGNILGDSDYRAGLGQEALKHLKFKGGMEGFRQSVKDSLQDTIDQQQDILNQAKQGLNGVNNPQGVSPSLAKDLYGDMRTNLRDLSLSEPKQSVLDNLQNDFTDYISRVGGSANQNNPIYLNNLKQKLGAEIGKRGFQQADRELSGSTGIQKDMYNTLKTRIEDLAEAAQPGLKDQLVGTNDQMGKLLGLTKLALQAHAKQSTQNNHLGDVVAYTAGKYLGEGNPLTGIAALGAKKFGEGLTGYNLKQLMSLSAAKAAQSRAGLASKAANMLDQLPNYSGVNNIVPASLALSKNLSEAAKPTLGAVADKLNQAGFSHIGSALNNAIQSGNEQQKNALIYSIASNPQAKKALMGEDDQESEVK